MRALRALRHNLIHPILELLQPLMLGGILMMPVLSAAPKPNVLLICIDDLKPLLGCYGDEFALSPSIDKLAGRSLLFKSAYCNQAVCAPSRNSLITGLRPQTLGVYDLATNFRLARPNAVTFPQHFKNSGYHTEALGKILHTGHGNHEDAESWSVPPWKPKVPQYVLKESTANPRPGKNGMRNTSTECADVPDSTYGDGAIADEAILRLKHAKSKPDQPFLLAVGFLKPHLPFVAPKKYWDLYDEDDLPLASVRTPPAGAPEYAPQFGGELRQYADIPKQGPLPEPLQKRLIHGYYAATSYTDAQIGRVIDALDEFDLSKNTIIVLWGDHGWHLGDHGMWCKHTNYEQAARIPLLVSSPDMPSGGATSAMVESVDLYPTLCELAGLPTPKGLDGLSFVPTLRESAVPARDHVIHVYPRGSRLGRAIRTDSLRMVEWKKIGASSDTADIELYDYKLDPLETNNLVSERPAEVAKLRALLAQHPEAKAPITSGSKSEKKKDTRRKGSPIK